MKKLDEPHKAAFVVSLVESDAANLAANLSYIDHMELTLNGVTPAEALGHGMTEGPSYAIISNERPATLAAFGWTRPTGSVWMLTRQDILPTEAIRIGREMGAWVHAMREKAWVEEGHNQLWNRMLAVNEVAIRFLTFSGQFNLLPYRPGRVFLSTKPFSEAKNV